MKDAFAWVVVMVYGLARRSDDVCSFPFACSIVYYLLTRSERAYKYASCYGSLRRLSFTVRLGVILR